ncbi:hypothetical protein Indivirus_2_112 [Indivirus ILV1]|uniref:Uncharacterized protein n=1 Tax=Indivirus ILV1 TaxID=1977633 RepID=A0A1V0SDD7_9VIRU|nr:hypothetical protein Indivirus_2_112 [Indivirus ILV1]
MEPVQNESQRSGIKVPSLLQMTFDVMRRKLDDIEQQKLIRRYPSLDQCNENLKEHDLMIEQIKSGVFRNEGTIFGGFLRDMYGLNVPHDMDVMFQDDRDRTLFLNWLLDNFQVHIITKNKYHNIRQMNHNTHRVWPVLVICKNRNDLYFQMDLTLSSNWEGIRSDFDVNQFTSSIAFDCRHTFYYNSREINILKYRILGKVCRVIDAKGVPTDDHEDHSQCILRTTYSGNKMCKRITHMESKGWSVEGKGQCTNPLCILGDENSWKAFCTNRQNDLDRVIQILHKDPRLVKDGYTKHRTVMINRVKVAIRTGNSISLMCEIESPMKWKNYINEIYLIPARRRLSQIIANEKARAIRRAQWENAQRYISHFPPPDFKDLHRVKVHSQKKVNEKKGGLRK